VLEARQLPERKTRDSNARTKADFQGLHRDWRIRPLQSKPLSMSEMAIFRQRSALIMANLFPFVDS
jgi:hypothetical protein